MTTYRLMDGVSGRPGVASSGTQPPASPSAFTGNFLCGLNIKVTQSVWLQGYWFWVCPSGQSTAAQKFALWQTVNGSQAVVAGSVVTSGTLTAGQFNFVALSNPIPLSVGIAYMITTGFTNNFPDTQNQFGSGNPYASGITNGPLFAYSDGGASGLSYLAQGVFSTSGSDPSVSMPATGDVHSNFWIDCQVTDQPPANTSYRLFPNIPIPPNQTLDTATNFTLGTEFSLSQACSLNKIWFYSQPGATQLPTETGIWAISGTSLVSGTHLVSPSWSGAAGSGWVSTSYSGVTLSAGVKYKTSVFNGAGSPTIWNVSFIQYWNIGPGLNGITTGPLSAPNEANASAPGQSSYHQGVTFAYPDTYDNVGTGDNYWVDVEVTPVSGGGLLMASFP